ncbi:MAG: hypothetical protein JNM58_06830 [Xanthomonadaceae bacterium]|nr:hypothetical protein [Xanthomonadaceae bacterium]
MSDQELEAHVTALPMHYLAKRGVDLHSFFSLRTERDSLASQRAHATALATLRRQYLDYLKVETEAHTRRTLDALSPGEKHALLAFAQSEGQRGSDVKVLPLAVADRWLTRTIARGAEVATAFPLADPVRARGAGLRRLSELVGGTELHPDRHENTYAQRALRDHIRSDPFLSKIGADRWRYRIGEDVDAARVWNLLQSLRDHVPGREPQLVYFLDRTLAASPIERMDAAWATQARARPRRLEHDDIDAFLAQFAGQTVIMVGHIEHRHFVQERSDGGPPLRIEIPALLEAATRHQVMLVPVGCNSASEGAHFGFTRAISTDEVAALLRAIPSGRIAVGELLSAFNAVDGTAISVDAARFDAFLEITAHRRRNAADAGDKEETVTVLRIPAARPTPGQAPPNDFATYLAGWESTHRPALDKGALRAWRAAYRDAPITTLFLSGLACILLLVSWEQVRSRWLLRDRLIGRSERMTIRIGHALGGLLIASALLRWVAVMWPVLVFVLVVAVVYGVVSALFDNGERTA